MNMCMRVFLLLVSVSLVVSNVYGSSRSDFKKAVQYIVAHPVATAKKYAKICAEGVAALYAVRLFCYPAKDLVCKLKDQGIRADKTVIDGQIQRAVLCFSLGLTSLTCASWFVHDLKHL